MKILVVVGEFPKLSQTFILNQITGLIDAGHEVTILAKQPAPDQKVHEDVRRYRLQERVIYYGASEGARMGKFRKLQQFAKGLAGLFLKHGLHQIRLNDFVRHPNLILMARCLTQTDLSDRQIILAHFGPNGILAQKCMERGLLGGRLFVAFHGYDMLRYVRQKGNTVYQDLFRSPAILLPISDFWRRRCLSLGAKPEQIIVHHMGIDLSAFQAEAAEPEETLQIVSAARLVEKKGLDDAIEAIRLLVQRGFKVHYAIAGDGPLAGELHQRIQAAGLETVIELVGWCTQEEWIHLASRAQLVLAPSVTSSDGDMEGIPVQLMEALAMERLVIATRHSGIPELIADGANGWLVAEHDPVGLATAIEAVIRNPERWTKIVNQARQTVAKEFNIETQNARLIRLFERDINP